MPNFIHHERCPICLATEFHSLFTATDHTVSGESFTVMECRKCTGRFTQDIPDEASIGAYYQSPDYISHTENAAGLVNQLYKRVRNHTLRSKRKLISSISGRKTGHLLDVGAGTGAFLHEMKKHDWQVTGLEPDPGARALAGKLYGIDISEPQQLSTLPDSGFDVITLWHVLEHVHDLHGTLKKLHSLLKNNGCILIAVPNFTSLDAEMYQQDWAAYDVPRHLYHFSPAAMKILLATHGFELTGRRPMWFDSFYVAMLSNRNRTGSTKLPLAVWRGLRSNLATLKQEDRCSSLIYIARRRPDPS